MGRVVLDKSVCADVELFSQHISGTEGNAACQVAGAYERKWQVMMQNR